MFFLKKFYICLKLPSLASTAAQPSSKTQGQQMDLTQIERTVTQIKRVNHISIPKDKTEKNSGQQMDSTQIERTVTQNKRVNHISIPKNFNEENSDRLMDLTQIERTHCNVT